MALTGPAPVPCVIARPAWYRSLFYRLIWSFGLRHSPLGGFGGVLPVPSSG
jgi:hypothetical protein